MQGGLDQLEEREPAQAWSLRAVQPVALREGQRGIGGRKGQQGALPLIASRLGPATHSPVDIKVICASLYTHGCEQRTQRLRCGAVLAREIYKLLILLGHRRFSSIIVGRRSRVPRARAGRSRAQAAAAAPIHRSAGTAPTAPGSRYHRGGRYT